MAVKLYEEPKHDGMGWLVAIVIIAIMLLVTTKCQAADQAKIDTMICKVE